MIELDMPFMVDFEITNRCPCKCAFCEANLPNTPILQELSTAACFRIIDKLSNAGVLGIFLTGGEPFCRADLPQLIRHCFDVGLEPTVSTSGFILNEDMIDAIRDAGLNHIQISIHGQGKNHESVVNVPGVYPVVLEKARMAIEKGIDVEVACVGIKQNFESIPNLLSDLADIGVRKFRVLRFLASHSEEMLDLIPPRRMVMEIMPKIEEISKKCSINLLPSFCPGLVVKSRSIYEGTHPMALTCPAGKSEFAILPNGDVFPCINLKDNSKMYAGNILKDDIQKIWDHPIMVQLRGLTPADYTGICGKCERKNVCYSARCVAYNLTGDLYGDDVSCYKVREQLGHEV